MMIRYMEKKFPKITAKQTKSAGDIITLRFVC